MGLTHIELEVANPARPELKRKSELLVDSGAVYSVVDGKLLEGLGIRRAGREAFLLANGDKIEHDVGSALFIYQGNERASTVIFGEEGDSPLLGSHTLEAFGLVLDPFKRELRPMRMLLGRIAAGG